MPINVVVNAKASVALATVKRLEKTVEDIKSATNRLNRALGTTKSEAAAASVGLARMASQANRVAAAIAKASKSTVTVAKPEANAAIRRMEGGVSALNRATSRLNEQLGLTMTKAAQAAQALRSMANQANIRTPSARQMAQANAAPGYTTPGAAVARGGTARSYGNTPRNGIPRVPSPVRPRTPNRPPDQFRNNPLAGVNYWRASAAQGNPVAVRNFLRYMRLNDQLQRGQAMAQSGPQGPMSQAGFAVMQAMMRTRFGRGAAGLAGQVLGVDIHRLMAHGQGGALAGMLGGGGGGAGSMLGMLGAGGPGIAMKLITVQIIGMIAAVKLATAALNQWKDSLIIGGGTPSQAGQVTTMEKALGLGSGRLAEIGKGLSGIAAIGAKVSPITGPYGDMNYNRRGLRAAEWIRSSSSRDQARRRAELAGAPELASTYLLSQETWRKARNPGPRVDPSYIGGVAEMNANKGIASDTWTRGITKVAAPATIALSKLYDAIDDLGRRLPWDQIASATKLTSMALVSFLDSLKRVWALLDAIQLWIENHLPKVVKDAMGWKGSGSTSIDKNTRAVEENTQAIREGTYGGGPRANSGPSKLNPAAGHNYRDVALGML